MIQWYGFFWAWIPVIAYVLIGRWIGTASRKAWIVAQKNRVLGRVHDELHSALPWTFYLFFPYTAATRRIYPCFAEYMVDRDVEEHRLSKNDLLYVRANMVFWPLRILILLATGTAAIWTYLQARDGLDARIARLEKRRLKLSQEIDQRECLIKGLDSDLECLIVQRNDALKQLCEDEKSVEEKFFLDYRNLMQDANRTFGDLEQQNRSRPQPAQKVRLTVEERNKLN